MCNVQCELCGDKSECEIINKINKYQEEKRLQCIEVDYDCYNCNFFVQEENYEEHCAYDEINSDNFPA